VQNLSQSVDASECDSVYMKKVTLAHKPRIGLKSEEDTEN